MAVLSRAYSPWKLLLVATLACVVALTSLVPLITADAGGGGFRFKRAENCLMNRVNRLRVRHGLSSMNRDRQLTYVARTHADSMADAGGVWHDQNVNWKVTHWVRLGQNTGRGRSCKSLTRSFMNSYEHRKHILGRYRFMGIGTVRKGGKVYVQELFESRHDPGNVYHYP